MIKNSKIQMLAGNSLKMYVTAGFEISLTLITEIHTLYLLAQYCFTLIPFSNRSKNHALYYFLLFIPRIVPLYTWHYKVCITNYQFTLCNISQRHKMVLPYPLQYTTLLELTAHLIKIAIECAFFGQKSSFWAIFSNRVRKFVLNLN